MQLVESVQLGLLISGKREVLLTNDEASYLLPGETIQSSTSDAEVIYDSDRRLRREFSTTINLRNRRTTI